MSVKVPVRFFSLPPFEWNLVVRNDTMDSNCLYSPNEQYNAGGLLVNSIPE
jgi:hypothetical protein